MKFKNLVFDDFSVKEDGNYGIIEGFASRFDVVDSYGDLIEDGAFDESLAKRMPKMLWQHDSRYPLGFFTKFEQIPKKGLYCSGKLLLDLSYARNAYILLKNDAIDGLSIGYRELESENVNGVNLIKKVELYEVSIVTFPANELAVVENVKNNHSHVAVDKENKSKNIDLLNKFIYNIDDLMYKLSHKK